LQRHAAGLGSFQRAKALGNQGDFIGGEKELATAMQALPDNTEAPASTKFREEGVKKLAF
jgi:hypothetical protein